MQYNKDFIIPVLISKADISSRLSILTAKISQFNIFMVLKYLHIKPKKISKFISYLILIQFKELNISISIDEVSIIYWTCILRQLVLIY
jgi:hypothetical protein